MELSLRVAQRIRSLRKARRLSQLSLAEKIGRTVDAVSALERGKSLPSFETLSRLANALDVPVKDFFDFPGGPGRRGGAEESPKRVATMATLLDLLRSLPDRDLAVALRQIQALAERN